MSNTYSKENLRKMARNFINLGLIDNYVGGVWKDMPSFQLNNLGHRLYDILNRNNWFDNHLSI